MYNEVVDERGVNLHKDFSSFFSFTQELQQRKTDNGSRQTDGV